jgi:hypothetical protein
MADDTSNEELEQLISKYFSLRLKGCLLNTEFAKVVNNSDNGHIYLKALHENVL